MKKINKSNIARKDEVSFWQPTFLLWMSIFMIVIASKSDNIIGSIAMLIYSMFSIGIALWMFEKKIINNLKKLV